MNTVTNISELSDADISEFYNYIEMWERHATSAMKYWFAMTAYWYPKDMRREIIKKIFNNAGLGI